MSRFSRVFVCGLGRCGSSLTMQMLDAGGIPTVGDWPAYEPAAAEIGTISPQWLMRQSGAVKVIDPHRFDFASALAADVAVISLSRNRDQQAASQIKFMTMMGGIHPPTRQKRRALRASLSRDQAQIDAMLRRTPARVLYLCFEDLVGTPQLAAKALAGFLAPSWQLDTSAMADAVRQRGPDPGACLPNLLEAEMIMEKRNQG